MSVFAVASSVLTLLKSGMTTPVVDASNAPKIAPYIGGHPNAKYMTVENPSAVVMGSRRASRSTLGLLTSIS